MNEQLKHFGVLGMHWGHRKGPSSSSGKRSGKRGINDVVKSTHKNLSRSIKLVHSIRNKGLNSYKKLLDAGGKRNDAMRLVNHLLISGGLAYLSYLALTKAAPLKGSSTLGDMLGV